MLSMIMIIINTIYDRSSAIAKSEQLPLTNPANLLQLNLQSSNSSNTSSGIKGVVSFEGTPAFGNNSRSASGREIIPNYKIEIFGEDGKTKIAQTTTDREGKFFVSLPAGHYIIYTQAGPLNMMPHDIVVKQGQIVFTDLVVDVGVR
jgi:hypothetical protein